MQPHVFWLLLFSTALQPNPTWAQSCNQGVALSHQFDSGARWQLCAHLDPKHALELRNVSYQAPNDTIRSVLASLHLGQLLWHYHDEAQAQALISDVGFGGDALLPLTPLSCNGERHQLNEPLEQLCSETATQGMLSKYSIRPALIGHQWTLFTVSTADEKTWKTAITFSEDGRLSPEVSVSGKITHFGGSSNANTASMLSNEQHQYAVPATLTSTWRIAFDLDLPDGIDTVEEFNFNLSPESAYQRTMNVMELQTESFRQVDNDTFRGWRVRDISGRGYYLDPQDSGYAPNDQHNHWAQFDLAVTRSTDCERHALGNQAAFCGRSLDDFVNAETLVGEAPVLWYTQSRLFRPKAEDFTAMSSLSIRFDLMPFDWSSTSPFELPQ